MSKIHYKSPEEIAIMRESGKIAASILEELINTADVGVTTLELDKLAAQLISKHEVTASFKGFEGYPYSIVTCLNEAVVHGMPNEIPLVEGDILTIDFGVIHKGFHSDTARTKEIGTQQYGEFLKVGKSALQAGIDACVMGNYIGDISHAIQSTVEDASYGVVRAFVGHGVGRSLHEDPQVPGFGKPRMGIPLKEGMVLAVEVMYTMGDWEVEILDDGWTAVTADGSLSGMYEHTVAITSGAPKILTAFK
ncbi:type I methionyl aminopeptidase [bacterium]|uniref:Methionine aminopeptidase n=2 Tax=Katanobacteria TaxID=422282 RepID=A0A2M7X048_UNCKA|nr:type I methionyl aminopeptidase [bacterium]PIP56646.1 MAG: type I methionyl aminopeptidase [candidate division WWE3 bacterium CG22_combo_CG10-13_8_21_14_all_39_12]PJA39356.1 MAG: type I methionyl aminopeptidase [candidate division WWE3 bacterium CG_4_9_14_3_um_filter_39_7]